MQNVSAQPNQADPKQLTTFQVMQMAISEVAGLDPEEITLDAEFEEDLGVSPVELLPIVNRVKSEMNDPTISNIPFEAFARCATIAEMVELIDEERDL